MTWRMEVYSDTLMALLEPGESMILLASAAYMGGEEKLDVAPPRFDAGTVLDMVFGLPAPFLQDAGDRWVSGTSLRGWPGCMAQLLASPLSKMPDVLMTDRRMLLLSQNERVFSVEYVVPRTSVIAVRRAFRIGQAGRVIVTLSDGSSLAITFGLAFTGNARRFVAAWQPLPRTLA